MRVASTLVLTFVLALCFPATSRAQETRLTASPATSFGLSVSIDGDVAIVGDPGRNSAHFFRRTAGTWALEVSFSGGGQFGSAVSILGSTAVIGAPTASTVGRAYVYTRSGPGGSWRAEATSTPVPFAMGTSVDFGAAVAVLSPSMIAVGAPRDSQSGGRTFAGSVYVSTRDGLGTWTTLGGPLRASDAAASDALGTSVAGHTRTVSGTTYVTLIAGAPGDGCDTSPGVACGSAYVFLRTGTGGFVEQAKLSASDAAVSDAFGTSVAVFDDVAVIGSPTRDVSGAIDAGAAYVFGRAGTIWSERVRLTASDAEATDLFGHSVGLSGGLLVVGAYGDDCSPGVVNCGAAYAFSSRTGPWIEERKYVASDGAVADALGRAIAVSGTSILAGAYGAPAAYVFEHTPPTPPDAGVPDAFVPSPDAFVPSPDAFVPEPDASGIEPDAAFTEPDAGMPGLDAAAVETADAGADVSDASMSPATDAAASLDAAANAPDARAPGSDAGLAPTAAGCGCVAAGPSRPSTSALTMLALVALSAVRRRGRSASIVRSSPW